MLTKEDLNQIGGLLAENNKVLKTELKAELKAELVPEIVGQVVSQVGEMLEQNILPQFDMMNDRFDRMEARLDRTDGKVNTLTNILQEKNVITLADKSVVLS